MKHSELSRNMGSVPKFTTFCFLLFVFGHLTLYFSRRDDRPELKTKKRYSGLSLESFVLCGFHYSFKFNPKKETDMQQSIKHKWGNLEMIWNMVTRSKNKVMIDGHDLGTLPCDIKYDFGRVQDGVHVPVITLTFEITDCNITARWNC